MLRTSSSSSATRMTSLFSFTVRPHWLKRFSWAGNGDPCRDSI
jgi:hypothetical protein